METLHGTRGFSALDGLVDLLVENGPIVEGADAKELE